MKLLPKLSLKTALVMFPITLLLLFSFPMIYNHYSQSSEIIKYEISKNKLISNECHSLSNYYIIPWKFHLEDYEKEGSLEVTKIFKCDDKWQTLEAKFHIKNKDSGWLLDSLVVNINDKKIIVK